MAFGNLDPNSDTFTSTSMVPGYKDGISYQFLAKLAENTSYNWRHSDNIMLVENEWFTAGQEKDFDVARDYTDAYLQIIWRFGTTQNVIQVPTYVDTGDNDVRFLQLTASYQSIEPSNTMKIKYNGTTGFRIKNDSVTDYYLLAAITELRKITGS